MSKFKSKSSYTKNIKLKTLHNFQKFRNEDMNPTYEVNRKNLPAKLYHGTSVDREEKILKEGLDPATKEEQTKFYYDPEEFPYLEEMRFSQFGVFLTKDLSTAIWFSLLGLDDAIEEDIVVFEVDVAKTPENVRFGSDGRGELMTNNTSIPIESIKKMNIGEIKKRLKKKGAIKDIAINLAEKY